MGAKLLDFVTTSSVCVPIVGSINWWWVHPKVLLLLLLLFWCGNEPFSLAHHKLWRVSQ
jgi:hypothetical protein